MTVNYQTWGRPWEPLSLELASRLLRLKGRSVLKGRDLSFLVYINSPELKLLNTEQVSQICTIVRNNNIHLVTENKYSIISFDDIPNILFLLYFSMFVHNMHTQCPQKPEERFRNPGTGVQVIGVQMIVNKPSRAFNQWAISLSSPFKLFCLSLLFWRQGFSVKS